MSKSLVVYWHQIAWRMVRHLCSPDRAVEYELAARYDRARRRARARYLRERAKADQ